MNCTGKRYRWWLREESCITDFEIQRFLWESKQQVSKVRPMFPSKTLSELIDMGTNLMISDGQITVIKDR